MFAFSINIDADKLKQAGDPKKAKKKSARQGKSKKAAAAESRKTK